MQHTAKEPAYRIVSGAPAEIEEAVNRLVEAYVPVAWNFQAGVSGPVVTVVLLHSREIRKAQLAQPPMVLGHGVPRQ